MRACTQTVPNERRPLQATDSHGSCQPTTRGRHLLNSPASVDRSSWAGTRDAPCTYGRPKLYIRPETICSTYTMHTHTHTHTAR